MLPSKTLAAAFDAARQEQATLHGRPLSDFDKAVGEAVFRASSLAIADVTGHRHGRVFRVVSAPTGSGKSCGASAFIAAAYRADPKFSCAYVVETIKLADEMGVMIAELIGKENVTVWTTDHEASMTPERRLLSNEEERGGSLVMPPSYRSDLLKARVVVVTHKLWKQEMATNRDQGVRNCHGRRRSIVFVDEHPDLVKLIERTPGDLQKLQDRVYRAAPDHAFVPTLEKITARANEAFKATGATYAPLDLVVPQEAAPFRNSGSMRPYVDHGLTEAQASAQAEDMELTVRFIEAAAGGCVFVHQGSTHQHRALVAYEVEFAPGPGHVLLDATADITGMTALMAGMDHVDVPAVDYSNLEVVHIDQPRQFKFVPDVIKKRRTAEPYAEWIRNTVLSNTTPEDKVLVVCHKALIDHGYMYPSNWNDLNAKDYASRWAAREVEAINWGAGIGSNDYRLKTAVFLFSEFHVPRKQTIANVHGWTGASPTPDALARAGAGTLKGDYLTAHEGHLLRWTKQLACRGSVRNIDQEGRCGRMRLYTSMDLHRLLRNMPILFPRCKAPTLRKTRQRLGNQEKLVRLLLSTDRDTLWSNEIAKDTGVRACDLSRVAARDKVRVAMARQVWTLTTRKEQGLPGKGTGLTRKASVAAAA